MTIKMSKPVGHTGSVTDRQGNSYLKSGGWGDNGSARPTTEEYREAHDKINFSELKTKKRSFRVKVNGEYVDDHLYEPKEN